MPRLFASGIRDLKRADHIAASVGAAAIAITAMFALWISFAGHSTWELALAAFVSFASLLCLYWFFAAIFSWPPLRRLREPPPPPPPPSPPTPEAITEEEFWRIYNQQKKKSEPANREEV
jgi:hypothetical protein